MKESKNEKEEEIKFSGSEKTVKNKERFILCLDVLGTIKAACRKCGIHKTTMYYWRKTDEAFRMKMDEVDDNNIDTVESVLFKKALQGNMSAIKFYLENKRPEVWGRKLHIGLLDRIKEIDQYTDEQLNQLIADVQSELQAQKANHSTD